MVKMAFGFPAVGELGIALPFDKKFQSFGLHGKIIDDNCGYFGVHPGVNYSLHFEFIVRAPVVRGLDESK